MIIKAITRAPRDKNTDSVIITEDGKSPIHRIEERDAALHGGTVYIDGKLYMRFPDSELKKT